MEIRILGALEVVDGDRMLDLGGVRQRALLARLAISANRVVSVDLLLDDVWGPELGPRSKQALQAQVSRIRRALGDHSRLVGRAQGYVLRLEPDELDAARFEAFVGTARAAFENGDVALAAALWADAERCWRGPVLIEFAEFPFAHSERARLEELRLAAIEARIQVELDLGRHDRLVAELDSLVAAHPYRERLWAELILALYRSGRQADALAAYQRVRRLLGDELGIPPGPELSRLDDAVVLQKPELDWVPPKSGRAASAAPNPVSAVPPHNLRRSRSSFVGRDDELDDLDKLLAMPGLVTIVGPGGVGKTRLAVETGRRLLHRYRDGVWFVELAPVGDPALVPNAAAAVVGVREESGRTMTDALASALATREALVVLDNCEHVIDAAATLADAILAASETVTVLATSREPLRVEGEVVWRAPSLPVPPPGALGAEEALAYDSVRLFSDRAQDQGRFAIDFGNAAAVGEVCRRLDGIPLALELAAARLGALTAGEILAGLDDGFALLTQGRRTALPRQQTLHAAIGWSYDLLAPEDQALFRRLSVFAGNFDAALASAVCGGPGTSDSTLLDELSRLVDKSLVIAAETAAQGTCYRMLETIREYGAQRLDEHGETAEIRDRHLDAFLALAERAEPQLLGPEQAHWLERLQDQIDNLYAAIAWSLDRELQDVSLRLTSALLYFWDVRGHLTVGLQWLSAALAGQHEGSEALRAKALFAAGRLALLQGESVRAETLLRECLTLSRTAGDLKNESLSLSHLAAARRAQGDVGTAVDLFEQSLYVARNNPDDKWTLAVALNNLGGPLVELGDRERGRQLLEASLKLRRELGDRRAVAVALCNLCEIALLEEDYAAAAALSAESLSLSEELGYEGMKAQSLCGLTLVALARHNFDAARPLLLRSLDVAKRLRTPELAHTVLLAGSALASCEDDWDRAARLAGAAEAIAPGAGDTPQARVAGPFVAQAQAKLEDLWTSRWREGHGMDVNQALAIVLLS